MKSAIVTGVAALVLLGGQAQAAAERDMVRALMAESTQISRQLDIAKKKEQELANAKQELLGVDAVLKRAEESLRRNVGTLEQQAARFEAQLRRTESNGCPWGGKAEASYARACNSEMQKLIDWANELKGQRDGMAQYARRVQAERRNLSENTVLWGQHQASVNKDLELLGQARAAWQQRFNNFVFQSQAYEQLKRVAPGSRFCEGMVASDPDRAAQCLQRLFDNAR